MEFPLPTRHLSRRLALTLVLIAVGGVSPRGLTAMLPFRAANLEAQASGSVSLELITYFDAPYVNGQTPSALIEAGDGTFYGTTAAGGFFGAGTLFRVDAAGVVTTLRNFDPNSDGSSPMGLVRAIDGRVYGYAQTGGRFGFGTIFRIDAGGALTTVHHFANTDGSRPNALSAGADGNIYGATAMGGAVDGGTAFSLDLQEGFQTIASFNATTGRWPTGIVKASDGRLYGTARDGGQYQGGTVFTIDEAGAVSTLRDFSTASGGYQPLGLIQGSDGRLYGTTFLGGSGSGTVFAIDTAGVFTTLHFFSIQDGPPADVDLVEGTVGSFDGVADRAIYRVDASGTYTIVHAFTGPDGADPGWLTRAANGALYGTTSTDTVGGGGTVYRIEPPATLTTLHYFRTGTDGATPNGIIQGSDGRLYGTTGVPSGSGLFVPGTVFVVDGAVRTALDRFSSGIAGRGIPRSGLYEGSDGNFYGTTWKAAEFDIPTLSPGMVFRMSPEGNITTIAEGFYLSGGVIEASDGNLFGTTAANGFVPPNYGTVFRISPGGNMTQLYRFNGTDGNNPVIELTEARDGTLWGTSAGGVVIGPVPGSRTYGTIFQIDRMTGALTTRYTFSGLDGSGPEGRLVQGIDGRMYGTTSAGGASGYGTIFAIDSTGMTTLYNFAGGDGANPHAGMVLGDDGRFYGVTRNGGAFNYGTMFALDAASGTLTTLYQFAFTDGAYPVDELFKARDGSFYGTTSAGGPTGGGVVFHVLATPLPSSDTYFEIVSRGSGKCLDVFGASTEAVAAVIQWVCHGGANQQWRLEPAGGGAIRIIARHSGQALDVYGALPDDGTPIIQYPVHSGDNQVWTFEPASDGYVRVVARHSGKALDVEFASVDDGARVIQYTGHGGTNQQWLLRAVP